MLLGNTLYFSLRFWAKHVISRCYLGQNPFDITLRSRAKYLNLRSEQNISFHAEVLGKTPYFTLLSRAKNFISCCDIGAKHFIPQYNPGQIIFFRVVFMGKTIYFPLRYTAKYCISRYNCGQNSLFYVVIFSKTLSFTLRY